MPDYRLDPNEVRVFSTGALYVAPVGTTLPTTLTGTLNAAFEALGYADEGITVQPEASFQEIPAWQSRSPVRVEEVSRTIKVTAPSMQFNRSTIEVYFGGGTWTSIESGAAVSYAPPVPGTVTKWAAVLEAVDGDVNYRYVFERMMLSEVAEIAHRKDAASKLQVTLTALAGTETEAGWSMFSDDPSLIMGS